MKNYCICSVLLDKATGLSSEVSQTNYLCKIFFKQSFKQCRVSTWREMLKYTIIFATTKPMLDFKVLKTESKAYSQESRKVFFILFARTSNVSKQCVCDTNTKTSVGDWRQGEDPPTKVIYMALLLDGFRWIYLGLKQVKIK